MTPYASPITPEDVGELIDLTVPDKPDTVSMAKMQRDASPRSTHPVRRPRGLSRRRGGHGQDLPGPSACGLAVERTTRCPDPVHQSAPEPAREVGDDYRRFFASNYRRDQHVGDGRVTSTLFREPIHRAELFPNLRSWTVTIGMPGRIAPFLRHTSFTRPVFITRSDFADMDALWYRVETDANSWGLYDLKHPARCCRRTRRGS